MRNQTQRPIFSLFLTLLNLFLFSASASLAVAAKQPIVKKAASEPGEYIVVLNRAVSLDAIVEEFRGKHGLKVAKKWGTREFRAFHAVELPETIATLINQDYRVELVEENGILLTSDERSTPNWALDRIDQRGVLTANADYRFRYPGTGSTGAGVTAFVFDTGVWSAHSELAGRVAEGYNAVPFYEDNGFTCTATDPKCGGGYDGASWTSAHRLNSAHGTAVASALAGTTVGVAPQVELVPVRMVNYYGLSRTSWAIEGLVWVLERTTKWRSATTYEAGETAVPLHGNGHFYRCVISGKSGGTEPTWPTASGSQVTDGSIVWQESGPGFGGALVANASWYDPVESSPGDLSAIGRLANELVDVGVFFATSANNQGNSTSACNQVPARVARVVTVGGTSRDDTIWTGSNRGPCVDIYAPGDRVVVADLASTSSFRPLEYSSGTSFAAPLVVGAAASYLGTNPTATPATTWSWIRGNASTIVSEGASLPLLFTRAVPISTFAPLSDGIARQQHVSVATVSGTYFQAGITASIGGVPATVTQLSNTSMSLNLPAFNDAGRVKPIALVNPSGDGESTLRRGFVTDFTDVPYIDANGNTPFFYFEILAAARNEITKTADGLFRPLDPVTRGEMAIFIVRAMHGLDYTPRAATNSYADVGSLLAPFVEQAARDGVMTSCGVNGAGEPLFCPNTLMKRKDLPRILLKAMHDSTWEPGIAYPYPRNSYRGLFVDVPASEPEALYIEFMLDPAQITTGCVPTTYFCPEDLLLRQEMAAFLVRSLKLQ